MSLKFDGVDDTCICGAISGIIEVGSPLTILAWVKPYSGGLSGAGRIVSRSSTFIFCTNYAGVTRIRFLVGGTTQLNRESGNVLINGSWQHVAATWDGSITATNIRLFHNGTETTYSVTTNGVGIGTSGVINIGCQSGTVRTFDGNIAHVQIFNRILEPHEIRSLMYFPRSISNGLQLYYPLQGDTSPEPDMAGIYGPLARGTVTGAVKSGDPPIPRTARLARRYFTSIIRNEGHGSIGARAFRGNTDSVICQAKAHIANLQQITVLAWIRPYQFSSSNAIISKLDGTSSGLQFFVSNTGASQSLQITRDFSGGLGRWRTNANSLNASEWQCVAMTYDCSADTNIPSFYINSIKQAITTSSSPSGLAVDETTGNLDIGRDNVGNGQAWIGEISQIQIFNRILSRGEITQLMYLPGSISNGLVAYLPLRGSSSPEPDLSKFRNNGTVVGCFHSSGPPSGRNNRLSRRIQQTNIASASNLIAVNLTLSMILTSTLEKDVLKSIIEALTLSESKSLNVLKEIAESITLSHPTPTKDILKVLSENLIVTESQAKDFLKIVSDNLVISESESKNFLKVISEAVTLTELPYFLIFRTAILLHFIKQGMISPDDKINMLNDLITTGLSNPDKSEMIEDSDSISWDFHNG